MRNEQVQLSRNVCVKRDSARPNSSLTFPKKEGKEQREREKKGPAHFWRSVARFRALGKRLFWNLETEAQKNEVEHTEFV